MTGTLLCRLNVKWYIFSTLSPFKHTHTHTTARSGHLRSEENQSFFATVCSRHDKRFPFSLIVTRKYLLFFYLAQFDTQSQINCLKYWPLYFWQCLLIKMGFISLNAILSGWIIQKNEQIKFSEYILRAGRLNFHFYCTQIFSGVLLAGFEVYRAQLRRFFLSFDHSHSHSIYVWNPRRAFIGSWVVFGSRVENAFRNLIWSNFM